MGPVDVPAGLTAFQVQVSQLFFTRPGAGEVPTAADALEAAAHARGWSTQRVRDTATFCRLVVAGPENLLVDVYVLARRYSKALLLSRAAEVDAGFSTEIFADMLDTLSRFSDQDLPIDDVRVTALREFFAHWAAELRP